MSTVYALPVAPTNIQFSDVQPTTLTISWEYPDLTSASTFHVFRRKAGEEEFVQADDNDLPQPVRQFADSGLEPSTDYEYYVQALAPGVGKENSEVEEVTTSGSKPDAPTDLTSPFPIRLKWKNPGDGASVRPDFYYVARKADDETAWTALAEVPYPQDSYTDETAEIGHDYQYSVAAGTASGGLSAAIEITVTTAALAPTATEPAPDPDPEVG